MRVLVVEDNLVNRALLREVLTHRGHAVEEVGTAADAIAALSRAPTPDVVLLDIDIPGSGLRVAAHVRETAALAGVTVVAVTALAMRGDRERFLAAGCHGYVSKPIDVGTFTAEIESLRRRRAGPLAPS